MLSALSMSDDAYRRIDYEYDIISVSCELTKYTLLSIYALSISNTRYPRFQLFVKVLYMSERKHADPFLEHSAGEEESYVTRGFAPVVYRQLIRIILDVRFFMRDQHGRDIRTSSSRYGLSCNDQVMGTFPSETASFWREVEVLTCLSVSSFVMSHDLT